MTHPNHVAVVGSGVAGLLAAHVLGRRFRVTLYEADTRLGGHADTHVVEHAGQEFAIDTGFIVHNLRTYPHLLRLFDELGVATQDSEMSMSVRADEAVDYLGGLEYAGALGGSGLFPTWRNALRPSYLRMLTEIPRFHRMAKKLMAKAPFETGLGGPPQGPDRVRRRGRCGSSGT
jgi:predicted NAD/FAD-binding protein